MLFFGTFEHSIDERGRIAIPARFRHAFADGGVLRPGPEGCVEMYPSASYEAEVQRRLGEEQSTRTLDARRLRRNFLANAFEIELDRQGRALIPTSMRERLTEGRAFVVGCGEYLEIWHPDAWNAELQAIEEAEAE